MAAPPGSRGCQFALGSNGVKPEIPADQWAFMALIPSSFTTGGAQSLLCSLSCGVSRGRACPCSWRFGELRSRGGQGRKVPSLQPPQAGCTLLRPRALKPAVVPGRRAGCGSGSTCRGTARPGPAPEGHSRARTDLATPLPNSTPDGRRCWPQPGPGQRALGTAGSRGQSRTSCTVAE